MECLANTLDSPHIAKLLTTIEVSQKVSCNERSDYHLVLEAADRSVDGLLKDQRWRDRVKSEGITSLDLAKWLLDQIFGLCDALREFHEGVEIGQFDNAEHANRCDEKHKKHLLHCDIKVGCPCLAYQNVLVLIPVASRTISFITRITFLTARQIQKGPSMRSSECCS